MVILGRITVITMQRSFLLVPDISSALYLDLQVVLEMFLQHRMYIHGLVLCQINQEWRWSSLEANAKGSTSLIKLSHGLGCSVGQLSTRWRSFESHQGMEPSRYRMIKNVNCGCCSEFRNKTRSTLCVHFRDIFWLCSVNNKSGPTTI